LHCWDDPEQRPSSPELRAFVVATLKLVELIKDIIAKASVFEEEDFLPLTYGFVGRLCLMRFYHIFNICIVGMIQNKGLQVQNFVLLL
jgi:hypothetical protein